MQTKDAARSGHDTWESLTTTAEGIFYHGAVFRLQKATWPHETPIDLLLIADSGSPSRYTLVVSTGYKAGLPLICLPAEASAHGVSGIDRSWLIANWQKWVYPDCPPEDVLALRNYPPGVGTAMQNMPPPSRY